ncbi:MAG: EAL domain-containing protein, partial [Gammaproteobacteria bacterium]|nr:EAL domain-containing protein [Gammaproteobacteria bacterium]
MHQSVPTPANSSRFWRLLRDLRIRQLLLMVFGLLSIITISAIAWNTVQVFKQYNKAERISGTNAIGHQALTVNALLASERGFTAALLANLEINTSDNQKYLSVLRQQTDQGLQQLFRKLDQYSQLPKVPGIYSKLETTAQRLLANRLQADQSLLQGITAMTYNDWITILSQRINEISMINRTIMAPLNEEDHVSLYSMYIKEAFLTFTENAGLERALISTVIAQQRPFTQKEYQLLDFYQSSNLAIEKRLRSILQMFPVTPEITFARTELQQTHNQDYQSLRTAILDSSASGQPYPVNAAEWFTQATDAVNAVLNLSSAVDLHFSDDIEIIKTQNRHTVLALIVTLILVLSIFIISFMATYRRILMPLRELEHSAHTIARGDFSHAIEIMTEDEFGEVAEAFEVMRNYLFNDRERRQKAEDELRKLSTAIEQSVSSIIITNAKGTTEYINPQFHLTTGYSSDEVIGHRFNLVSSGQTPPATYRDLWNTIKQGKVWEGELLNKKKNGELYWELVSISPVRNREGKIAHYISVQHDITERKALEEQLNFMAYHDELTRLPNRILLADRFEQLTSHARRSQGKIALLILDLDRFKLINDSLGHRIGDQLLIEVARRLKHIARSSDTIARYGGDEFVILVNGFTQIETLIDLAQRLIEVFAEAMIIEEHSLHVSASIGISVWPDDGDDMETLLRQADTAMYLAKDSGRGQFQFFTDELNQQISQRLRLENDLRQAMSNDELELYYQPQIQLASGTIIGAEALIRWNHPELGQIPPVQFIPLAEETHLIRPIGAWVLQSACNQAVQWIDSGHPELSIAVNVSARQLDDKDFVSQLKTILENTGLDPDRLEIEITESAVMIHPEKMLDLLNNIKQLGVKLSLDDFGTGYSSLSYLRRFPFDKLKIDRSFIMEITNKPQDAAIARSISEMAHDLNMTVLAEGVETDIQAAYVRRCCCDEIQGYLISRPLPAAEFEQFINLADKPAQHINDAAEQPTILIVNEQSSERDAIRKIIKQPGFKILDTEDGHKALDILARYPVQVIITDYHLADIDGKNLLDRVKDLYPEVIRIAFS